MNGSLWNLVCRNDLPILILYNVDPEWPQDDIRERLELAQVLTDALKALGHPMISAILETSDLTALLQKHDPKEIIVFNWCEDIPGIPHSCALAAQKLEMLGFTYTGADFNALTLSQDKRGIKRRLEKAGIPTPNWNVFASIETITWQRFPAIVKPVFETAALASRAKPLCKHPLS